MTDSREEFEKIERYLNGTLGWNEKIGVESQMADDSQFAEEVSAHRVVNELILDHGLLEARKQMRQWHHENEHSGSWGKPLLGVSALLGLMFAAYLLYFWRGENFVLADPEPMMEKVVPMIVLENDSILSAIDEQLTEAAGIQQDEMIKVQTETAKINLAPISSRKNPEITISSVNFKTPEKIELKSSDCFGSLSTSDLRYTGSCIEAADGFIDFSSMHQNAIAYSIDSGQSYQHFSRFEFLQNGVYHPAIFDDNGCVLYGKKLMLIPEADCHSEKNYVINLNKNEFWTPDFEGYFTIVEIFNSTGTMVFTARNTGNVKWYGQTNNSSTLTIGNYLYFLKNGSEIVDQGNISLIR